MRHIRIFATLALMAVLGSTAVAQMVTPVDFMRNNPRSVFANPAFFTKDYGYFDLALGGITVGAQNIGLKYNKFFQYDDAGYPIVLDLNNGVASLRDVNYVNEYLNFDIFNCGRRTKYGYFTYTHRLREMESFSYSKDLVKLLANGNAAFLGESNPANIDLKLSARTFQEFDFGYQMCLTDQWNIGLRLKFLMGFEDLKTNALNVKLYTDPETYALKIMTDADITASLPLDSLIVDGKLRKSGMRFNPASLFKNYGAGIDLGAEYLINDQWGVAAAINDLGFIHWNYFSWNYSGGIQDGGSFYDNGAFVFSGLTPDMVNGLMNDPNYGSQLADSLLGYLQLGSQKIEGYTTGLNANMMVRGYYDLTPEHRFSAQLMGYNMGLGMKPAMTLAYTGSFGDKYDVVATYTMMPGSFDNLGIGLSANFGGMMMYLASNNVLGFFNLTNTTQEHLQFGISFTSGDFVDRAETVVLKDKAAQAAAEAEAEMETEGVEIIEQ
ncbi:MAG: DUF5723 family protein [Bacteroidales bacterium]|nr:DUF5723 family protein [Bacteroidales bacterium]